MENEISLVGVRNKLQSFQSTVMKDVQKKMDVMVEEVIQEIQKYELKAAEFREFAKPYQTHVWSNRMSNNNNNDDKSQSKKDEHDAIVKKKFPDKIFAPRESYLTCLLQVEHMKSIYHIFLIMFLIIFINSALSDYFIEGRVNFGLGTVKGGFRGIHYVFGVWSGLHVFVFGLFYAFKLWINVRHTLGTNKSLQSFWSYMCVMTFIFFEVLVIYIGSITCIKFNLPFVSSTVILLESFRVAMKMHAFVRTNVAYQVNGKMKSEKSDGPVRMAPFSAYLYYLFAPTFVYRESYPRTQRIRWKFALINISEFLAIAMAWSYIFERYMEPSFKNFGKESLTYAALTVKIFGMLMPGMFIYLGGFYMMLHAWLNFTSELLRFSDRMFYKDWWTATNYETYYRNWNVVIHDYLYEYVYKDVCTHFFRGSKLASSLFVFLLSAYVHEHVLAFGFKFCYPVMYSLFIFFGVSLIFLTKRIPKNVGNLCLWFSLLTGNGIMISLYLMEHYARINCHVGDSWKEYFVPISWRCNGITAI